MIIIWAEDNNFHDWPQNRKNGPYILSALDHACKFKFSSK